MRKVLLTAGFACAAALTFTACNKGDDNPYGNWKCVCLVKQYYFVNDTTVAYRNDTGYYTLDAMDRNTAKSFCDKTQVSYTDTLGTIANCLFK
jgi:hypothetical protein